MRNMLAVVCSLVFIVSCASCSREPSTTLKPGGVYSIENGDGTFAVVKLLVLGDGIAHVRLYKNKFSTRPRSVDLSTLTLGSIDDPDGFGIGHMPVQEAEFRGWHPQLLAMTELTEEELEGYEMWKEAQGGAFGN